MFYLDKIAFYLSSVIIRTQLFVALVFKPFIIFECCSMPDVCNSEISRGLPCGRISYRVKSCYLRAQLRSLEDVQLWIICALNSVLCKHLKPCGLDFSLGECIAFLILCSSYCMFLFSTVFRCWYIHFYLLSYQCCICAEYHSDTDNAQMMN